MEHHASLIRACFCASVALAAGCGETAFQGSEAKDATPSSEAAQAPAQQSSSENPKPADAESADVPVWTNSSYLCEWHPAPDAAHGEAGCALVDADGHPIVVPQGSSQQWTAKDAKGAPIAVKLEARDPLVLAARIAMPALAFVGASISVSVTTATGAASSTAVPFAELLPGLDAGDTLRDCLESDVDARRCFAATRGAPSIEVPVTIE